MEKYFSCAEVAEKYGVKTITVWQWVREKKLGALKFGKLYRITPQDLENFEKSRKTI